MFSGSSAIGKRKDKEKRYVYGFVPWLGVYVMAQLVVALRYRVAGSIPDGVIGIFSLT